MTPARIFIIFIDWASTREHRTVWALTINHRVLWSGGEFVPELAGVPVPGRGEDQVKLLGLQLPGTQRRAERAPSKLWERLRLEQLQCVRAHLIQSLPCVISFLTLLIKIKPDLHLTGTGIVKLRAKRERKVKTRPWDNQKPKTKGPWADTKIVGATTKPPHPTHNFEAWRKGPTKKLKE